MKLFLPVLVVAVLTSVPDAAAQATIRVSVIDGHSGKPVVDARVSLVVVRHFRGVSSIAVADGNHYQLQVQQGDTLVLENVTKSTSSWNEYRLCASGEDTNPIYEVATILNKGLQAPNNCNRRIIATPTPGEVVFFVTHLSFFKRHRPYLD